MMDAKLLSVIDCENVKKQISNEGLEDYLTKRGFFGMCEIVNEYCLLGEVEIPRDGVRFHCDEEEDAEAEISVDVEVPIEVEGEEDDAET